MKFSAFVLAFAMVATALPMTGLVANAAEDATDSVSVMRAYNKNNSEHLLTIDQNEYSSYVNGTTVLGEGTAWKAPTTSSTPIYRIYNPNSGEHLLVTEGETNVPGWQNEGLKMYSDDNKGVPIYRVFNPNATDAGSHHYCGQSEAAGLVAQGWNWDNNGQPVLYGVTDASNVVTLMDKNGLQADGTASVTDTLQLVYGSEMGIPNRIVWYLKGAVYVAYSLDGGNIGAGFTNAAIMNANDDVMPAGEWYVQVENTSGQLFTTNAIVVSEANKAALSNFAITDPILTGKVDLRADSGLSVASVTLNKDYAGDFYILPEDDDEFSDIGGAKFTPSVYDADDNATGNTYQVTKASEFTDDKFLDLYTGQDDDGPAALGQIQALKYVDSKGVTQYKMVTSIADDGYTTRGSSYRLVFDQDGDVKTGSKLADWNATSTVECPYLIAPTSIKVTNAQATAGTANWAAQLYYNDVEAKYINSIAVNAYGGVPINYNAADFAVDFYSGTSTSFAEATEFDTTDNGVAWTLSNTGNMYQGLTVGSVDDWFAAEPTTTETGCRAGDTEAADGYVFAKFTADEGIFGEDEFTLTSEAQSTTPKVADLVVAAESTTDYADMNVKFTNLKQNANVALVSSGIKGTSTEQAAAIKEKIEAKKFDAVTTVNRGAASTVFDNVLKSVKDTTNGDYYAVVVIPEDTTQYSAYTAQTLVSQIQSDYSLAETQYATGATKLTVLDQFGNKMNNITSIATKSMTGTATVTANATQFAMDTDGVVTLTPAGTSDKAGDTWSLALTDSKTFKAKVTNATGGTADAWTVWIE